MFEFFKSFFKPHGSSATAKERLRLVLLSDHLALAPDVVAALKADLLEVISRYVEFDPDQAEVSFEQREHEVAMLASVPILAVRTDRPSEPEEPVPLATVMAEPFPSFAPELTHRNGNGAARATTTRRRRRRRGKGKGKQQFQTPPAPPPSLGDSPQA